MWKDARGGSPGPALACDDDPDHLPQQGLHGGAGEVAAKPVEAEYNCKLEIIWMISFLFFVHLDEYTAQVLLCLFGTTGFRPSELHS